MNFLRSVWVWVAGIVFLLLAFPVTTFLWLLSFVFDPGRRLMVNRWMVFQGICLTRMSPIWRIKVEGKEKIDKNQEYVIICNHQSILDIVVFNVLHKTVRWVSKSEVFKVPLLGWSMKMTKYISIERGNKRSVVNMMEGCISSLNDGISVVIFPEGTRSLSGIPGKFKTGAFQLALKTRRPILPVILDGTGNVLPKNGMLFHKKHDINVMVLDPVFPKDFGSDDPAELAVKFQKMMSAALDAVHRKK